MNKYSDRIWLVLLGVAVAVLVLMTTMFWSSPTTMRSGASLPANPTANQAKAPKIVIETLNSLSKSVSPPPRKH